MSNINDVKLSDDELDVIMGTMTFSIEIYKSHMEKYGYESLRREDKSTYEQIVNLKERLDKEYY